MPNRREFLKITAGAGGAALAGGIPSLALPSLARTAELPRRNLSAPPLRILVLGGTGFIGPHLVRHAVSREHSVTIFTRGRHDAELPSGVTRLQGDRNGKLEALEGKTWDAVVDDSATNPEWVRQSTALLKEAAHNYLFTSSTGVYYPYLARGIDESAPVHYDVKDAKDGSETYGVAKAQCERATQQAFGDRAIIVRPTYIVGPGDTTDRFPYWPQRLARGGEVLAPGKRDDPVQFIDVRDLAEFMVHLLEQKRDGVYNAVGPRAPLTADAFYRAAAKALDANVRLIFVDDYDFLAAHKIDEAIPWAMLRGNDDGMMSVKNDRAIAAGLGFRPLAATVRDTLAWWHTVPEARRLTPHFTITPEQEALALADWHARGRRGRGSFV
jgi:2'-hydroxyisoflavone reductase